MWEELFKRYWQVAILKESPENTPHSPLLLVIVVCLFFILVITQWYFANTPQTYELGISVLAGAALLCSYFVYTTILLKIYRKVHRALQTLTTLLVSHMIIHFCAFPLLFMAPILLKADMNQVFALFVAIIYLVLTLLLTIWQFLVTIYIYKQAIEVDYLSAAVAGFGLLACNILIVSFWQ